MTDKRWLAAALAAGVTLAPAPIFAQPSDGQPADDTEACIAAHVATQRLRRARKLRAARAQMQTCTRPLCPAPVVSDCTNWLRQTIDETPTVIVAYDGHEVADARVRIDGELIAERLDGKPLEVDPGEHLVRVEPRGATAVERQVVIREGQRRAWIDLAPATNAAVTRPIPALVWPLGALGLAGLTGFAVFGLYGRSQKSDLEPCKGSCAQEDVDAAQRSYLVADVSLLLGVVSLGAATAVFLTRPRARAATSMRSWMISATPAGARFGVCTSF